MPEGDTVHRIAAVLGRAVTGRTLDRLELKGMGEVRELAGATIEGRVIGNQAVNFIATSVGAIAGGLFYLLVFG